MRATPVTALTAVFLAALAATACGGSPAPATPAGYYRQSLAFFTAAGKHARSASAIVSLVTQLPLNSSAKINSKLNAELNRTVGKN
jgi:hypothetical protein